MLAALVQKLQLWQPKRQGTDMAANSVIEVVQAVRRTLDGLAINGSPEKALFVHAARIGTVPQGSIVDQAVDKHLMLLAHAPEAGRCLHKHAAT